MNSINGLAYKNDPAIFSWNIFNEPRCSQTIPEDDSCKPSVQRFIDQMAAYIKGIDKNHMVRIWILFAGQAQLGPYCQDLPTFIQCACCLAAWHAACCDATLTPAFNQVTVGEEGFFAAGDPAINGNPQGTWSGKTGQDFRRNHVRATSAGICHLQLHMRSLLQHTAPPVHLLISKHHRHDQHDFGMIRLCTPMRQHLHFEQGTMD